MELNKINQELAQTEDFNHAKIKDLKEEMNIIVQKDEQGKDISDFEKENIKNIANEIANDLVLLNSSVPMSIEEYVKILDEVSINAENALKLMNLDNAKVQVKEDDMEMVLDSLINMKKSSEQIMDLPITKNSHFKTISKQAGMLSEFIEVLAGTMSEDGIPQGNGNTKSTFIKENLEKFKVINITQKNVAEVLSEMYITDNNQIINSCKKITAELQ